MLRLLKSRFVAIKALEALGVASGMASAAMLPGPALPILSQVGRLSQLEVIRSQILSSSYSTTVHSQVYNRREEKVVVSSEDQNDNQGNSHFPKKYAGGGNINQIGWNVSRKDKVNFLVKTILDLNNSKEAVYGTLDGWVAWEQDFPIGKLRTALIALEKEQEWLRIIQVIKWMLSKGQGTTMGTYGQLIRALDMDQRPEEAHKFWQKRLAWICMQFRGSYAKA